MVVALRLVMALVIGIASYVAATEYLAKAHLDAGWYGAAVTAEAEVTSILQNPSGKMVFARMVQS